MQRGREQFPVRPVERTSRRPILALTYLGLAVGVLIIAIVRLSQGDQAGWGTLVLALLTATLPARFLWNARRLRSTDHEEQPTHRGPEELAGEPG